MEWKLGQRFQLRLQVSTMTRILNLKKTLILKIQRPGRQPCDGGRERRWGTSHGSWKHHERPQSIQVTPLGISEPGSSFHQGASRYLFVGSKI